MKIVVIGTSNSVKKNGWLKTFRLDRFNDEIENLSIGANSSLLGITRALQENDTILGADIIILDFSVNDQNYIDHGILSELDVAFYLDAVLSHLISLQKKVLLLFFPIQTYIQTEMPIKKIYYQKAEKWDIPIFDIDMATRYLFSAGIPSEILFSDPNHCSDSVAQIFGIHIAKTIDFVQISRHSITDSFHHYQYKSVATLNCPLEKLENSLISFDTINLNLNHSLTIYNEGSLEAIFVNVGEMGCIIRITNGRDTVIKNFYDIFGNTNKFCVTLKLLNHLIPDLGKGITIEVVNDNTLITSKTMHEGERTGKSTIQIIGFIFRLNSKATELLGNKTGDLIIFPNESMKQQAFSILQAIMDGIPIISGTTLRNLKHAGIVNMVADILRDIGHFMNNRKNFQSAAFFFEHALIRQCKSDGFVLILAQIYMKLGKKELCRKAVDRISKPDLINTGEYTILKQYLSDI